MVRGPWTGPAAGPAVQPWAAHPASVERVPCGRPLPFQSHPRAVRPCQGMGPPVPSPLQAVPALTSDSGIGKWWRRRTMVRGWVLGQVLVLVLA